MFIAALDQSGGSTPGALEKYGVKCTDDNMMDLMHEMRSRVVQSPAFKESNIGGVILFKDSLERGLGDYLDAEGFDVYAKVDVGINEDGSLKDFDIDWLDEFPFLHGTKMRSVVQYNDRNYIRMIVIQQLMYAYKIKQKGLVPIVEPEVPIHHPQKDSIEMEIEAVLERNDVAGMICKLTIPMMPVRYNSLNCPVVALSGGYTTEDACFLLENGRNHMGASFSRALLEGLHVDQTDEMFDNMLRMNIEQISNAIR